MMRYCFVFNEMICGVETGSFGCEHFFHVTHFSLSCLLLGSRFEILPGGPADSSVCFACALEVCCDVMDEKTWLYSPNTKVN
jgi:hypothetical protein